METHDARSYFPSLHKTNWIYFENAGGSQCLKIVADKVSEYLLESNVQIGATNEISKNAEQRVLKGLEAFSTFLNASDVSEIVSGASTSMLLLNFSRAIAPTCEPGQEIIVTNIDHEANISPWIDIAKERNLTIKFWEVNPETFELEADKLKSLLSEKTRLVCVSQTSNILGTINDVKSYAKLVHQIPGAEILVDGVAFAPHRAVNVQDLDADYYFISCYKIFGPHNGIAYGKKSCLKRIHSINHHFVDANAIPDKFTPGKVNFELTYALSGVIEYLGLLANKTSNVKHEDVSKAMELISIHEEILTEKLLKYLRTWNFEDRKIQILGKSTGDRSQRVATISFVVENLDVTDFISFLDKKQIGIKYANFYAKRLLMFLRDHRVKNLGWKDDRVEAIRISFAHYNTEKEVDFLISAMDEYFSK